MSGNPTDINEKEQTTIMLSSETKTLMRKFVYIDDADSRSDWIAKATEFREALDNIPTFKGLRIGEIIMLLKNETSEAESWEVAERKRNDY